MLTCLIHGLNKSKVSFSTQFNMYSCNLLSNRSAVVDQHVVIDW